MVGDSRVSTDNGVEPRDEVQARGHWWRCLFEASEDAQLVCRHDGAVVEANRKARQLLGLSNDAVLPAFVLPAFLTPASVRKLSELLTRTAGRQETLTSVSLLCRGQLSLIADLQVTPLGEDFSLVSVKDASRRWRMESHVQRLITAVNSTMDVVYITDPDFHLSFVNAAFQQVTGHTIEEAMGQDIGFLRASSEASKQAACQAAVLQGKDWRGEFLNCRADSTSYFVEAAVSPIHDKNGSLLGCVAFERDISAQKKLQTDLQLERDYTQSIINSVDAAIYTVDREFRLQHFNRNGSNLPQGQGWLDFPEIPSVGVPLLDYVKDPVRREELRAILEGVLAQGTPQELRESLDNGQHWLVKVTPWKHGDRVLGVNYVVVDETKFCHLQAQLFQSQKMETVGALAAGVAHDFNNLLLAIRGNITLLQLDSKLADGVLFRLNQIDQAAARAAEITQQLLSFSRSEEEREVVLDLNRVVQEVSHLIRRTLKGRVELHLELPDKPANVRLDNTRANQLLLNLAVNAQDAMPNGGCLRIANRLLNLNAEQSQRTGRPVGTEFVCCSVKDTGTGIPPEVLPRIFDPFFTTKAKGKGTGLGLAIVHNVVSRAGGFLEIDSAPGLGTTFHLFFPTVHAGATERPHSAEPGLVAGVGTVMVVDDMDFILEFTKAFLTSAGYEVLVASNAEEAMAQLETQGEGVRLLLTDYNMPGSSGLDLIKAARQRWPKIKCLLASGYLEEEEAARVESEVGAPILNKPYNVREATELVARVLSS